MPQRRMGKPTKWVGANTEQYLWLNKSGITFEVWDKWKRTKRKLGTLTISVGGLRWWPHKAPKYRSINWEKFAEMFMQ
jgi:hypothetical protein